MLLRRTLHRHIQPADLLVQRRQQSQQIFAPARRPGF
jgi:hypothetical protein